MGPGGGGLLLQAPGARSLGLPVGPAARLEWGGRSPELRLRVSRIVGRGARGRQAGSQLKAFSGAVGSGCSWPPPPPCLGLRVHLSPGASLSLACRRASLGRASSLAAETSVLQLREHLSVPPCVCPEAGGPWASWRLQV